jgi:sulfur carrier protein
LNGTPHELPNATLHAALAQLSLNSESRHVAIAVNETVVPRTAWDRVSLQDNDRVEIITAVAGG